METDRSSFCGCKGIRTCLECEKLYGILNRNDSIYYRLDYSPYFYCHDCDLCWPGWDGQIHGNHTGQPLSVDGIHVKPDFLTPAEETRLTRALDALPWDVSQSGRRKQNFGPKCNFKKRRLRLGNFKGFPVSTKFVQEKFENVDILEGYQTIEQCSLEYDPKRGASIDAHIDDCWVWGERIVTVNLLSDSVLSLTRYKADGPLKYNLALAPAETTAMPELERILVRIPMPRRSLIIFRDDVTSRRVCVAYREFTPPFLPGGEQEEEGRRITEIAQNSWF
ncbi:unnamed protein product [Nesidiocoris tenuis]|uniref:Isopenicillin N synthase-like Fe(2+) 2OG dioxygenase domain-containing protein n=1 Tax=Nesidiocoris tenuis TaxID=355587 RepID=A0A6H5H905_9HEMI|nr:unnamed protein product [Nesidiocoris tenuis]